MKLALTLGHWASGGPPDRAAAQVQAAERLGFESAWTSEVYGSDCFTPLAWWAKGTRRLKWGTAVCQLSARTPASTAMTALTLDHLTGGRFTLGLGVSGPQVVEGWYGQPYPRPLQRTREYVDIVRKVFARERVEYHGEHYELPLRGGIGLGRPIRSIVHPFRADLPIYLAAEGPRNVALAAEIADGWLPLWFSPRLDCHYRAALAEGFARTGARRSPDSFEVVCPVSVVIGDDVDACADTLRPLLALYMGGMGSREANYHKDLFCRLGYEGEARTIQDLYLGGHKDEAAAVLTTAMVEEVALVGPPAKIRDELQAWDTTCVTTLAVGGPPEKLAQIGELLP